MEESDSEAFDVIVLGAGFGGSLAAMVARRLGKSVLLVERDSHPRFAIGESTTPLTNLLLETLAKQYSLPFLANLATWGRWQSAYPKLPCGLKRGFSFFHHSKGCPYTGGSDRRNELLVAASPSESVADTHWYRPGLDAFLVDQATAMGVVYRDLTTIESVIERPDCVSMNLRKGLKVSRVTGQFVIDASGPRGALFRHLSLDSRDVNELPQTQALFSHFRNVKTCSSLPEFSSHANAPFSIDDAAVHHVFPQGWMWVLRFNHGVTSAGIITRTGDGPAYSLERAESQWRDELEAFPTLRQLFSHSELAADFRVMQSVPFAAARVTGRRWALLPSAAAAIDPLFSTGFPLNLLGVLRLGELLEKDWRQNSFAKSLERYARETNKEARQTRRLVALAYKSMGTPRLFRAVSYVYFAAVSYEESLRRLGRVKATNGFLLGDHSEFSNRVESCLRELEQVLSRSNGFDAIEEAKIEALVLDAIEPFNVIGIGPSRCRNWYGVDFEAFFAAGSKLQASNEELHQMLERAGISVPPGLRSS